MIDGVDGLPAFYSPDFLVRTANAIYLVETKAQEQAICPNVTRKLNAAVGWCARINSLAPEQRQHLPWHYVLLAENVLYKWQGKGAHLSQSAGLRPPAAVGGCIAARPADLSWQISKKCQGAPMDVVR